MSKMRIIVGRLYHQYTDILFWNKLNSKNDKIFITYWPLGGVDILFVFIDVNNQLNRPWMYIRMVSYCGHSSESYNSSLKHQHN